jgi:hypothetical protein
MRLQQLRIDEKQKAPGLQLGMFEDIAAQLAVSSTDGKEP